MPAKKKTVSSPTKKNPKSPKKVYKKTTNKKTKSKSKKTKSKSKKTKSKSKKTARGITTQGQNDFDKIGYHMMKQGIGMRDLPNDPNWKKVEIIYNRSETGEKMNCIYNYYVLHGRSMDASIAGCNFIKY